MVFIDAEKHKLDYKASERDNNIAALKRTYQGKTTGGASTIISKAKGEYDVPKRQGTPKINIKGKEWYDPKRPEGSLIYKTADDANYTIERINKRTGKVEIINKTRTQKSTKMAETDDANTLVSQYKHPMELVYADYANAMKSLANKARLEMVNTGKIAYSRNARKIYANEVESLNAKLNKAELNITKERAANRIAAAKVNNKRVEAENNGEPLKAKDIRKAGQQALTKAREEVGSIARRDRNIVISDKEWEAIQAGAVSETILKRILNNSDPDVLRQRAMPKEKKTVKTATINRIKAMSGSYTIKQIADKLGLSTSTVAKYLKGAN